MEYRSIKGFTGVAQIGFLFAFLGLGVLLAGTVQYYITSLMLPIGVSPTDTNAVLKAMLLPENISLARLSQVLGTFMLLFVPSILWSFVSNGKSAFWLGFSKHINGFQLFIGFFILLSASIAAGPLANVTKYILQHFPSIDAAAKSMESTYATQAAALSNLNSLQEYIVALFIMAFFPAMFEEVFFRGTVQNLFTKWWKKPLLAIIVTSILFSLVHSSIYLFLSRALLGFALGYMFYTTKNIWVNILAHFINNAIVLSVLFRDKSITGKIDLNKAEPNVHWIVGVIAAAVLVGLLILLQKYSKANSAKIMAQEKQSLENSNMHNAFANK
jgi:uncharacterized protein